MSPSTSRLETAFARSVAADHADLRATQDLDVARGYLEQYRPPSAEQDKIRSAMLEFVDGHPEDAHRRSCRVGHLTASALVVELESGEVLLHHHRKLDRWLQVGGHCDGDANLAAVALREAREESGIDELRVIPEIVDLDIHPIPARPGEPAHDHYDCRFLVVVTRALPPRVSEESKDLRWMSVAGAFELSDDPSVHRLLRMVEGYDVPSRPAAGVSARPSPGGAASEGSSAAAPAASRARISRRKPRDRLWTVSGRSRPGS